VDHIFDKDAVAPFSIGTRVQDDLQRDKDEAPSPRLRQKIGNLERRRKLALLIGAWCATTHVDGEPVISVNGRLAKVIWSASRTMIIRGPQPEELTSTLAEKFRATVVVVPQGQDVLAAIEARAAANPQVL
jgi:hypothetical protein